jgi:hypothetical protein
MGEDARHGLPFGSHEGAASGIAFADGGLEECGLSFTVY